MEKKLLTAAIVAALVIFVVGGASLLFRRPQTDTESSAEVIESDEPAVVPSAMPDYIAVEPPAGFSETSSPYYDKYYVKEDASIIITGEKLIIDGIRTDEYAEDVKEQYAKTVSDYELLSEDIIELSGARGKVLEFTYAIVGDDVRQDMACATGVIVKGHYAYIITCKSRKDTFGGYRKTFLEFIKSVKLADVNIFTQVFTDESQTSTVTTTTAAAFSEASTSVS